MWLGSRGTLRVEEQQFGPWIKAPQFNQARETIVEVMGYEQPGKATTHSQASNEAQIEKAVMESSGRAVESVPGTSMTALGLEAATPMADNGRRAVTRDGGVTYESESRSLRKHIPDFEGALKDIDEAIHNSPVVSNSKAANSVIIGDQIASSCNLVDIEIMDDDLCWDHKMPESKENRMEGDSGAKHPVVVFNMGQVDKGLSGADTKSRPNSSGSKRKLKLKPKKESVVSQNNVLASTGKSPKQGMWINKEIQRPELGASPSLESEVGLKRKIESLDREAADEFSEEKRKKVADGKINTTAAEVAKQPRRDQ